MEKDVNMRFWQRFAKLYGPFMRRNRKLYESVADRIRPELTPETEVLELACGSGQLSFPLASSVRRWEATDLSEAMLAEAKKRTAPSQLHFSLQDAAHLSYDDASFDAVVIANALHVVPHPEIILEEIRRVLRPGGRLYAPTFIRDDSKLCEVRQKLMESLGFHLYSSWNEEELVAFLQDHRFLVTAHCQMDSRLFPLCHIAAKIL